MIVVKYGVRKRRVKVKSDDSYQEGEVQFVSERMIFWKRTMSAVSRRSGQTSEGSMPTGDGVVSESIKNMY